MSIGFHSLELSLSGEDVFPIFKLFEGLEILDGNHSHELFASTGEGRRALYRKRHD